MKENGIPYFSNDSCPLSSLTTLCCFFSKITQYEGCGIYGTTGKIFQDE
ncbi:hypothetical protein DDI_4072 [Dickeya dianthicola RNS04.9]|nr:hypothetical protein DDI_4072 [Dickeya dianthicola RNS04.9]